LFTPPAGSHAELIAARAGLSLRLGMANGAVILGPSHPMILEAIAAGLEPFIFSESSKDDQNKSTPGDFCNLLGE
jgi:hypothetical protein